MAVKQTAGRDGLGAFAPKFAQLNDDVLFGELAIEVPGVNGSNEWLEPVDDGQYPSV